ncbi:MAG: acyl-CoA dehydrogenase [Betaproteobacteria bacterium]
MEFVLRELAQLDDISRLPGYEDSTLDTALAILEEAGKFASAILEPLNRAGDIQGSRWVEGFKVRTPDGFKEAYKQFREAGWTGMSIDAEHGGQGIPVAVNTLVEEIWRSANHSFSLCPLLTVGAIHALELRGSPEMQAKYLPRMVAGEWTGTMNLTESQAGSDLALVRTRAEPQGDGTYKVFGTKIFITYGEQDYTDNIIHLVLARTPTAPEGVKGISLFVVPKFLVNDDGSLGARNDVRCVSIEHKMGIHASPTCVMQYGDEGGAIGYVVGEENRGLEYMFIMMNSARFAVGIEGIGLSERAYQRAASYAKERVQSKDVGEKGGKSVPIVRHPDIRRMLMSMRSQTEAMRALAVVTAAAIDHMRRNPNEEIRQRSRAFVDLMIPLVKGWSTDTAQQVTYDGVQVHGGMGFIEETGAAQHYRDARITTIYEGTTGIQANDLIGRKIGREGGVTARAVIAEMDRFDAQLAKAATADLVAIRAQFAQTVAALSETTEWAIANFNTDIRGVFAGAVPYLKMWGITVSGWQMARAALISQRHLDAGEGDVEFYKSKIATTRFFADHFLSQAATLKHVVVAGAAGTLALADESF